MNHPNQALFPILIEPAALLDYPTDRDRLVHRELVRTLEAFGVLTLPTTDLNGLFEAIGGLGEDSKSLWRKVLGSLNDVNRLQQVEDIPRVTELLEALRRSNACSSTVQVFVSSEQSAEGNGLELKSGSQTFGATDVVLPNTIDTSPIVRGANTLGSFAPGTHRQVIAASVIRPLAVRSRNVIIFDPHLFDDILGTARPHSVKTKDGKWVSRNRDHVEWLVASLASHLPPSAVISLIGHVPTQKRADQQLLTREFVTTSIESAIKPALNECHHQVHVKPTLVRAPKKDEASSNRFLHFDCGFTFEVTHDMLRLGEEEVPSPDSFVFRRLPVDESTRVLSLLSEYANYKSTSARIQWSIFAQ